MALNNISVKVCGNPDSNSGFVPLLLFNSPSFAVEDQFYVGFDNCSYFFSIKVETTQTVYKLIKNNVKSYGASRAGSLVISFSIPKGYKLEGGYTPYDVLTQLKEEFLKCCMTCKDPSKESYEYKPGRVDQHILDEEIKKFTIAPDNIPHRVMNSNGPIGYIMRPEEEILKFFQDTKYPELQIYKEVLLAENVNNSNYTLIPNIKIPRPKIYSLEVNGVLLNTKYSNVDEIITIASGNLSDPCYNHKSVKFCIRDLIEGNVIENGIELDSVEEIIKVNTTTWATPKVRKINLKVIPQANENEVLMSNGLRISCAGRNIELSSDFSFILKGNEIANLSSIQVELKPDTKYIVEGFSINGDELQIKVQKKTEPKPKNPLSGMKDGIEGKPVKPIKESPVIDIKLIFPKKSDMLDFEKKNSLVIKVIDNCETRKTISSAEVTFNNIYGKDFCEGHFFVPKDYSKSGYHLGFENNKFSYNSVDPINFKKDEYELTYLNFIPKPQSILRKRGMMVFIPLIVFFVFVLGCFTGYILYPPISKCLNNPETSGGSAAGASASSNSNGAETTPISLEIDSIKATTFLTRIDQRLKHDTISFNDIDTSFAFYKKYSESISKIDADGKVYNRLNDYNKLISAIKKRDIGEIKSCIDGFPGNNFHVWEKHVRVVRKILKDQNSQNKFLDADPANINSFDDIKSILVPTTQPSIQPREHQYVCDKCGPNMWFNTEEELEHHKKLNHKTER